MSWIWLDEKTYPGFQKNYNTIMWPDEMKSDTDYCVADFNKYYEFDQKIKSVKFRISADSAYILFINNIFTGIGPAAAGGDFLCLEKAPKHYADVYELNFESEDIKKFDVSAKVRLLPEMLTDYSRGHGGFFFEGVVTFDDGTTENIESDSTWNAGADKCYNGFSSYDTSLREGSVFTFWHACETEDIWDVEDSHIPPRTYNKVFEKEVRVGAGKTETFEFELDKIYGVYPFVSGYCMSKINLKFCELKGQTETEENIVIDYPCGDYYSFRMHSAGMVTMTVENTDDTDVSVKLTLIAPWYPIESEGSFKTSNAGLNKVYDVCKHTLKICRQTLHLDSTKHQELLACTGDYNIESLMTMFCFGDMRLAEFDLMRTADWLCANDGVMFHTTYSLIWVQMLRDVYMITGRKEVLFYCENALKSLLDRFETYKNGGEIIENPPDFMFVDWTVIDDFSMHHPPKALGQTVLNAFYYNALINAADIYSFLDKEDISAEIRNKANNFKTEFNDVFFDNEKKLYFDGLGTPYGGEKHYHPANVDKKYFSKYPNILASLFGLADEELAKDILDRIIFDENLQDIQPYFMHYLLNAIRKYGMFEKYGMKLLERWIPVVEECDKGLAEGWIAPEESYSFDHSHAWGGTPAYQMPMALTGLEILEAGMKKIKFKPNLYGLDYAEISIPTEYGMIDINLEKDKKAVINAPECIEIIRGD